MPLFPFKRRDTTIFEGINLLKKIRGDAGNNSAQYQFSDKLQKKFKLEGKNISLGEIELKTIRDMLTEEFRETSFWQFTYRAQLNDALDVFNTALKLKIAFNRKTPIDDKATQYNLQKWDRLYKLSEDKYHATLMLPIVQSLDYRMGNSEGQCFGYTMEWTRSLLQKERPFGIALEQRPHSSGLVWPLKQGSVIRS